VTTANRTDAVFKDSRRTANRASDDFVMFHDMQQPLSALQMIFSALRRRVDGDPDDLRLLEIASSQTEVLQAMLAERLDRASPVGVQHRRPLGAASSDMAWTGSDRAAIDDIVRSVVEPLQATTAGQIGYFAADRPWVRANPLALRRVVANVVTNAVEASQPGGTVRIRLGRTGGGAELLVDDSGAGPGHKPLGQGVGLASSMAAVLGVDGQVAFLRSPLGGVRVRLVLPEATP
jgi:signal transduction histidine kinase